MKVELDHDPCGIAQVFIVQLVCSTVLTAVLCLVFCNGYPYYFSYIILAGMVKTVLIAYPFFFLISFSFCLCVDSKDSSDSQPIFVISYYFILAEIMKMEFPAHLLFFYFLLSL